MHKPQKILIAHQGAQLYGSDHMVVQLSRALQLNNQDSITIHLPHMGPLVDMLQGNVIFAPISILRLSCLKNLQWLNIKDFYRNACFAWQQMQQHDIVIVNTCVVLSYLFLMPFSQKRKFIYIHEIPTGIIKWGFNILLRLTGATLICNSQATAKAYPFIPRSHKKIVYNAVPEPVTVTKRNASMSLQVLLIGRLSKRKGHQIVLQALNFIHRHTQHHFYLRIVGDSYNPQSTYTNELKEFVAEHGLDDFVSFYPFIAKPDEHYQWADIVIMASIQPESFGLVALEAMHHHCAVIASDIGALPEIVRNLETGLLVQTGNIQSLAQALVFYAEHPDKMIAHGAYGQKIAQDNFSIDHYQKQINEIIHGTV